MSCLNSTATPLASKRDMVLMGLLTRQLAEIFLEPDGTSSVHASGFQPVSGAAVQRLNWASCEDWLGACKTKLPPPVGPCHVARSSVETRTRAAHSPLSTAIIIIVIIISR
jgi:hypothetical protein